ncbi:MAG: hypothetical protein AAGB02_08785 [Pseudomonadota bacterium]
MEITAIGLICLMAGAAVIASPMRAGPVVLGVFIPLQTAAAFNLWSVGGLSIISAHFLIGALIAGIALRPAWAVRAIKSGVKNPAVAALALFGLYAVSSAFFMPRLFEGTVQVYSLARPPEGFYSIPLTNLHPTSGNITQSIYLSVNIIFFAALVFLFRGAYGPLRSTYLINAITVTHLTFAVLNLAPQIGPVSAVFDLIRTANYAIYPNLTVGGFPRLIGSYAEASAFGSISAGLFAWNFVRFNQTRGVWHFIASLSLLGCIAFSFSSTAYAIIFLLASLWSAHTVYKLVRDGLSREHLTALLVNAALAVGLFVFLLYQPAQIFATELFERLFGAKLQSHSGVERTTWNLQGIQNFLDTNGFGVGLGSARTSSLATVLLSNVGFVGAILYAIFLYQAFLKPWPRRHLLTQNGELEYNRRVFVAARAGALALLFAHLIAGGHVDPGLVFMAFAGVATAAFVPAGARPAEINIEPIGGAPAPFWQNPHEQADW